MTTTPVGSPPHDRALARLRPGREPRAANVVPRLGKGAQIARAAREVFVQSGLTDAMPPANVSFMEPEERAAIRAWFASGARG